MSKVSAARRRGHPVKKRCDKRCDNCYGRRATWRGVHAQHGYVTWVCVKCKYILSKTEPKTRYK